MMETLISMQTGVRLGHSVRASEESEHSGDINDYQGFTFITGYYHMKLTVIIDRRYSI